MRFLTAESLFLTVIITEYVQTELHPDGKNVCLTTETYEDIVKVQVQKNKKEKKWCWNGQCSTTKLVQVSEPQVLRRVRIVPKCCDGYKEEIGRPDCVPECIDGCLHGSCIAPNTCECLPGFHGAACGEVCPEGRWGSNCVKVCECSDKGKCKSATGCDCEPGWRGERCDLPCQEGYFGHSCAEKCNCDKSCNPETGECIDTNFKVEIASLKSNYETSERNAGLRADVYRNFGTEMVEESSQRMKSVRDEAYTESQAGSLNAQVLAESDMTTVSADLNSDISREPSVSETTMTDFSAGAVLNETEVNFHFQNEINFLDDSETFSERGFETVSERGHEIFSEKGFETISERSSNIKRTELADHVKEIPKRVTLAETDAKSDESFGKPVTITVQECHNETNDFIRKATPVNDYLHSKFHFLASFSILSTISIIIIAIAAKWMIASHKRRIRKIMRETQEENILKAEKTNCQPQNFFWVNICAENPAYLSDVYLSNSVPILHSFKPVLNK